MTVSWNKKQHDHDVYLLQTQKRIDMTQLFPHSVAKQRTPKPQLSHKWLSYVKYMIESCHTFKAMCHMTQSHVWCDSYLVTYMIESYTWLWHICLSHITHPKNDSYWLFPSHHTYDRVIWRIFWLCDIYDWDISRTQKMTHIVTHLVWVWLSHITHPKKCVTWHDYLCDVTDQVISHVW